MGDHDESPFLRRGVGGRDESSQWGTREGGSTNHSQGEGVRVSCAPSKHSISLDGFDIKKLAY